MCVGRFPSFVLWIPVWLVASFPGAATDRVRVTLDTPRTEYVLGEPILLNVAVKNVGREALKAWKVHTDYTEPEIIVLISKDARSFDRYVMGVFGAVNFGVIVEVLKAGESREYSLRVLYAERHRTRLALKEPGRYWIKVRYPLITPEPLRRTELESNTVEVRVNQPKPADAEVWQAIRAPEFLRFIQCGVGHPKRPDVPRKVAELVRKHPKSTYDAALRWALNRYYERAVYPKGRQWAQQQPELEEIREALGMPKEPEGPFPDDRRLDVTVTFRFPEFTPLEDVFDVISVASGVPLRLAPELRIRRMRTAQITESVRKFMRLQVDIDGSWVPEPDGGYRLVPTKAPERTKVPQPPKQEGR